mmetsp:Transcript_16181/g.28704  ORF Transcript_16181/g.28704 Transcript_16181/m.28704 type:complete len:92 (+) Transcript_16181:266-541(+)
MARTVRFKEAIPPLAFMYINHHTAYDCVCIEVLKNIRCPLVGIQRGTGTSTVLVGSAQIYLRGTEFRTSPHLTICMHQDTKHEGRIFKGLL